MADVHDLAPFYVLDALEPDERATFEAHLPTCAACRSELDELDAGVEALARATAAPSPDLKTDVMAAIDAEPANVVPIRGRNRRIAAVAAVIAAVIAIVLAVGLVDDDPSAVDLVVAADDALTLDLTDTPVGAVQLVWSDDLMQGAVIGDGFPGVGADEAYAIWVIDETGPTAAGVFAPDGAGGVRALIGSPVSSGLTIGLTVEPAAGSPAPTGEILIAAELAS